MKTVQKLKPTDAQKVYQQMKSEYGKEFMEAYLDMRRLAKLEVKKRPLVKACKCKELNVLTDMSEKEKHFWGTYVAEGLSLKDAYKKIELDRICGYEKAKGRYNKRAKKKPLGE